MLFSKHSTENSDCVNTNSSLLTLSSPKTCKHISNLCQPLITSSISSKYPTILLEESANEFCRKRQDELGNCIKNKMPKPIIYSSYIMPFNNNFGGNRG